MEYLKYITKANQEVSKQKHKKVYYLSIIGIISMFIIAISLSIYGFILC